MSERPILFSGEMVRALLAGRKTQTRRVAKPRKHTSLLGGSWSDSYVLDPGNAQWLMRDCPYGAPGDRLWVREAWRLSVAGGFVYYRADREHEECTAELAKRDPSLAWRPSIHMPRWASRLTLEVVSIRVERLQDISEADAIAEGVAVPMTCDVEHTARNAFRSLWERINGPGSWDANPWVWVVEFRRAR